MTAAPVIYRAYAKLNLSLDVTGRREDGYHRMDMVNCSVSLFDVLTFTPTPGEGFSISSSSRYLPTGEKNLVWKAAALLAETAGTDLPQVRCRIGKRIPSQAGLGGGSADAAAALTALNELCGYGIPEEELLRLSAKIGADVPFCLQGGYARVKGIGEILEPFAGPMNCPLVLAMPSSGHSTKEIFQRLDSSPDYPHPDTDRVEALLRAGDPAGAMAFAGNVFEPVVDGEETAKLAASLREHGAVYAAMTGTGAAVFGMFRYFREAAACRDALRGEGYGAWTVSPVGKGVEKDIRPV